LPNYIKSSRTYTCPESATLPIALVSGVVRNTNNKPKTTLGIIVPKIGGFTGSPKRESATEISIPNTQQKIIRVEINGITKPFDVRANLNLFSFFCLCHKIFIYFMKFIASQL
jgi:hypothetical protein